MPHGNPDPTDPMALHGAAFEISAGEAQSAHREMAACLVREYFGMGFDPARILRMFQSPEYSGPFMTYGALGRDAIQSMIDEEMHIRGLHDRPRASRNGAAGNDGPGVLDS